MLQSANTFFLSGFSVLRHVQQFARFFAASLAVADPRPTDYVAPVMSNSDYLCAGCRRELKPGDTVRLLLQCEHFVHVSCAHIPTGRCSIDDQLLGLRALQLSRDFSFATELVSESRLDRLMGTSYLSDSCRNIGWIYRFECVTQTEAVKWFEEALDLNAQNANALLDLAECCEAGFGVQCNSEKAADLRKRAEPLVDKAELENKCFLGDEFIGGGDRSEIAPSEYVPAYPRAGHPASESEFEPNAPGAGPFGDDAKNADTNDPHVDSSRLPTTHASRLSSTSSDFHQTEESTQHPKGTTTVSTAMLAEWARRVAPDFATKEEPPRIGKYRDTARLGSITSEPSTSDPEIACANCRRELKPGDTVRLLLQCEHFVHVSCAHIPTGRCSIDDQLLDLRALQLSPECSFSTELVSGNRLGRLMGTSYLSDSCRNIGWIYRFVYLTQKEAIKWCEKALDLNAQNANALLDLAECYEAGFGVRRDSEKAADLRKRAEPLVDKAELENRCFLSERQLNMLLRAEPNDFAVEAEPQHISAEASSDKGVPMHRM